MRVRVLLNPKAGGGKNVRRLPLLLSALERAGVSADVAETRAPGDAPRIVREASREGIECLAVMGGDGTMNEVCQAYIDEQGQPVPCPDLAVVPAGTGGDFRRTFGLGTSDAEAVTGVRVVASGSISEERFPWVKPEELSSKSAMRRR